MSDLLQKCDVCGGLLDQEDLFCSTCGKSVPQREQQPSKPENTWSTHQFECPGCGASMSYDATAKNLRCPFCGSERMESKSDAKALRAKRVVPFRIDRREAESKLRSWLGRGFWRPGDLAESAIISNFTKAYVPYWVFAARTHTFWAADSSQVPFGAKASWYPVTGEHRGEYDGMLVGASSALSPAETTSLCPFDLRDGVDPDAIDLQAVTVEQFTVHRKYARPLARQGIEQREQATCAERYLPRGHRNLKVNVRIEELRSEPVLLPIWIMAYRYRDELYRFLLNGQTGQTAGEAPVSKLKIGVAIAVAIVLIAVFVLVMVLSNM